jgi:hypothetical protein
VSLVRFVGVVEVSWSISVSWGCSLGCSGSGTGGGGTSGSGTKRMTRSRSRRSRAESSSFGNRTCRVKSTDRSAGDACLRGLLVGSVVVVNDEFRDLIRDVMKARDCGRVMLSLVITITVVKCFNDIAAVGSLSEGSEVLNSMELWLTKSDPLEIGHSTSIYHLLIIICYIEYDYTFNDQKTSIAMHIRYVVVYDWVT